MLGFEPWARQAEILSALVEHDRVAVRTGHKLGKSRLASSAGLWWISTRPRGRVVLTSSSSRQVKTILWREIRHLCRTSRVPLGATPALDPGTGLQFADGRDVFGFTTDDAERMAGVSSDELLVIIDEASGFPQSIWEAVQGNLAGGGAALLTGNPTQPVGVFHDAFHAKSGLWKTYHVSSRESPNVIAGRVVTPGLATQKWIDDMVREYGEGSAQVAIRVDGDFADEGEDVVIGLALVRAAQERWKTAEPVGPLELGVDVARFGDDDSAIQPRRGNYLYPQTVVHGFDNVEVAGQVITIVRDMRRGEGERPVVRVDSGGNGGGVVDILKRSPEVWVVGVDAGRSARDPQRFPRRRDELWWAARDFLRKLDGTLPPDERLSEELRAPRYRVDVNGRVQVESKDDIKKRIGRSPDRADALCLAVCGDGTGDGGLVEDEHHHRSEAEQLGDIM